MFLQRDSATVYVMVGCPSISVYCTEMAEPIIDKKLIRRWDSERDSK